MRNRRIYEQINFINKEREILRGKGFDVPIYTEEDYLRTLPLSNSKKRMVFERDNFQCQYCKRLYPNVKLVVDHMTPKSRGGTNDMSNLITACGECNSLKTYKTYQEFTNHEKVKISDIFRSKPNIQNS